MLKFETICRIQMTHWEKCSPAASNIRKMVCGNRSTTITTTTVSSSSSGGGGDDGGGYNNNNNNNQ